MLPSTNRTAALVIDPLIFTIGSHTTGVKDGYLSEMVLAIARSRLDTFFIGNNFPFHHGCSEFVRCMAGDLLF